jgi:hypothetical protein
MADRDYERDEWARDLPRGRRQRMEGPYRDYGWEPRESALPEFRDPSLHRMPWDEEEEVWPGRGRGGDRFRRAYQGVHGEELYPDEGNWSVSRGSRGRPDYFGPTYRGYASGYDLPQDTGRNNWSVPGPYVGRGPKGYWRSNERIYEDVAERLTQHGEIDASDVAIHVENGEVTLTGAVDSRRTKRLAEDIADGVNGVRDVHNELRIAEPRDEGE